MPTVDPAEVSVEVINGTTTSGLAGTVGEELQARGFVVAGTGNLRRGRFPGGPPSSTVPVWRRTPTRSPRR